MADQSLNKPSRPTLDIIEAVKQAFIKRGFEYEHEKATTSAGHSTEQLLATTEGAHDILFKANTVFPFTLFPDTVTLDREKLTLVTRIFFGAATYSSAAILDILNVEADIGPFFGSVHISSRYFISNPYSINFMRRNDAIQLQRLLQGYIIVHERKINTVHVSKDDLITLLYDLGTG